MVRILVGSAENPRSASRMSKAMPWPLRGPVPTSASRRTSFGSASASSLRDHAAFAIDTL